MFEYNSNVIRFLSVDGTRVTVASKGIYVNNKLSPVNDVKNAHIAITPLANQVVSVKITDGNLSMSNLTGGGS